MRVVLVHGFNVRDGGARTVDKLAPTFRELGYTVDTDGSDYGFWNLAAIYFGFKRNVVRRLMRAFQSADVIVTHSNGAAFAIEALQEMPQRTDGYRLLFHFSPALNRTTEIPYSVDHQWVYHTRRDWVVRASAWLPGLPWGRMGSHGYKGKGPNTNIDETAIMPGHSGWFRGECAVLYARNVDLHVKEWSINEPS